jgi:hypothetical protein
VQANIVERMIFSPSRCFLCQRADGAAIDTGLQRPAPVGRVYVCTTSCLPEMIELSGGLSANAASEMLRHGAVKTLELETARAEILRLQPFERAILAAKEAVS